MTKPAIAKDSKVYVAGHRGLAGSAIVRGLKKRGYTFARIDEMLAR